jgi:hypothetical protein
MGRERVREGERKKGRQEEGTKGERDLNHIEHFIKIKEGRKKGKRKNKRPKTSGKERKQLKIW